MGYEPFPAVRAGAAQPFPEYSPKRKMLRGCAREYQNGGTFACNSKIAYPATKPATRTRHRPPFFFSVVFAFLLWCHNTRLRCTESFTTHGGLRGRRVHGRLPAAGGKQRQSGEWGGTYKRWFCFERSHPSDNDTPHRGCCSRAEHGGRWRWHGGGGSSSEEHQGQGPSKGPTVPFCATRLEVQHMRCTRKVVRNFICVRKVDRNANSGPTATKAEKNKKNDVYDGESARASDPPPAPPAPAYTNHLPRPAILRSLRLKARCTGRRWPGRTSRQSTRT